MTIENHDYTNSWEILLGSGTVDYLFLKPKSFVDNYSGAFKWIANEALASQCGRIHGNILRIVGKEFHGFFHLNLDTGTYTFEDVGFDGQPDQTTTVVQDDGSKLIYFTEEAPPLVGLLGQQAGICTRNEAGEYTNIIYGDDYSPETTGVAFSPNGMHMYFTFQTDGYVFDVSRTDGLSFFAETAPPSDESFVDWVEEGLNDLGEWLSPEENNGL